MNLEENEIEKYIEKFKTIRIKPYSNGDNVEEYIKYFNNKFVLCFKNGVIPLLHQKHELFNSYFRFRKSNEIKDFNSFLEYSYPHPQSEGCKNIKRVNLPQYPVFYCSHHPTTAISEMEKWNDNETQYVVSKWTKKNIQYKFTHIPTYPEQPQFKGVLNQTVNKWINGNELDKNGLVKFLGFLGDKIISDNDYSASACISYKYIYENGFDVISYPSCINLTGINFAFSPNIIDKEILVLDRVYIIELKSNNKITLYKVGIFHNNKIVSWHMASDLRKDDNILQAFSNDFSAKF